MSDPGAAPLTACVVTAARSEYGLMRWLMHDLQSAPDFRLQVVVTGSHLSEEHGLTYREIERDGFAIAARIPSQLGVADAPALTAAVGQLAGDLARVLADLKPDFVMVMGDRYELLGVMAAGVLAAMPMAHISGGEITEGAIDDQIRHAMTKASHLHFVANDVYGRRVRQMGEESWRVCVSGEPGLDNLYRQPFMTTEALSADVGLDLERPTALVTFHSVTLELGELASQLAGLTSALERASEQWGLQYLITYPNADQGFDQIVASWQAFVDGRSDRVLIKSLGQTRYLSALRAATMMIGNSSSGLVEAPSFNLPTVNIGLRQGGRMRGRNVIDVPCVPDSILVGIKQALAWDRSVPCVNPYGDGRSAARVLSHLREVFRQRGRRQILAKRFIDWDATLPDAGGTA